MGGLLLGVDQRGEGLRRRAEIRGVSAEGGGGGAAEVVVEGEEVAIVAAAVAGGEVGVIAGVAGAAGVAVVGAEGGGEGEGEDKFTWCRVFFGCGRLVFMGLCGVTWVAFCGMIYKCLWVTAVIDPGPAVQQRVFCALVLLWRQRPYSQFYIMHDI